MNEQPAPDTPQQLMELADMLNQYFNPGPSTDIGFIMLVFPAGENDKAGCPGKIVSNGLEPADMKVVLQEMIEHLDKIVPKAH